MFLFRSQLTLSVEHEKTLETFHYSLQLCMSYHDLIAVQLRKAPKQVPCFLKSHERIDETVSGASLKKFIQHLWFLLEELTILSLFDEDVDVVMFPSRELHSREKKSAGPFDTGDKQQESCTWTSLTRRTQEDGLHTEGRHNVDE
ncbi:hypothetical protein AVEN_137749-1 [Araneus ventricosus]|uniref:Uncharacterized protein n=1 Tax=Araneus ventricosus TaxID=182803 RepID=A0A4Y2NZT3_ARAVE|nr:hypothetical protein AVEN_137749-1 [Araneus ventricosus]